MSFSTQDPNVIEHFKDYFEKKEQTYEAESVSEQGGHEVLLNTVGETMCASEGLERNS